MTDLNAIRARLGSISDTTKRHLPPAVIKLLEVDIPKLVKVSEAAIDLFSTDEPFTNMCKLKDSLTELEEKK